MSLFGAGPFVALDCRDNALLTQVTFDHMLCFFLNFVFGASYMDHSIN